MWPLTNGNCLCFLTVADEINLSPRSEKMAGEDQSSPVLPCWARYRHRHRRGTDTDTDTGTGTGTGTDCILVVEHLYMRVFVRVCVRIWA